MLILAIGIVDAYELGRPAATRAFRRFWERDPFGQANVGIVGAVAIVLLLLVGVCLAVYATTTSRRTPCRVAPA